MPTSAPQTGSPAILITGAGSGIGRSTATRLAAKGERLILVGRQPEVLEGLRAELPGEGHASFAVDVTSGAAVAQLFEGLRAQGIQIGGLVHCAGIHWLRPIQLTSADLYQEMLDSHLKSTLLLLKEGIGRRLFPREGASVVLLSSAAALKGGPGSFAYATSKAGVISAARVAAVELAPRKIRVNAVLPGVVDTPQSRAFLDKLSPEQQEAVRREHPLGTGAPEDVAAVIEFLLSPGARWITGVALPVDGGLTAR